MLPCFVPLWVDGGTTLGKDGFGVLTLLFLVRKLAPTQAATAHKRSSRGPGTATGGFSFQ